MSVEFNYQSSAVDIGLTQSLIRVTHGEPGTNAGGPDQACKRVVIKAFCNNVDLTWVNFGTAAANGQCFPLDAGESISVPLSNTDQINCLFDSGGDSVAVAYSN